MPPDPTALERARSVKKAHEDELMAFSNVVAVGVGLRSIGGQITSEVAIIVSVVEKLPDEAIDPGERIPAEIDGVPVDVQQSGIISAGGI